MKDDDLTPSIDEFERMMDQDDNTWWRIACGHHLNLYEQAMEEVVVLRSIIRDLHLGFPQLTNEQWEAIRRSWQQEESSEKDQGPDDTEADTPAPQE